MGPVIENEPSYVFNVREYKENSVIASVLTLNYGRVSVMVRGKSALSIMQPFAPLKLSLNPSKTDFYFLQDYEYCGEAYSFKLPIFFCATYLNELLYYLYHSKDANPLLFGTYVATLEALKQQQHIERHLRIFELTLLESLGYGLSPLDQMGKPLQPRQLYRFGIGMGFIEVNAPVKSSSSKQEFLRKIANIQAEAEAEAEAASKAAAAATAQAIDSQTPVTAPAPPDSQEMAHNNLDVTPTSSSIANQNEQNSVSQWSDEELENAMRFSKHKVKGPRMAGSSHSSNMGFAQGQYSGLVTPEGRPIGLSELLGPAMSGELLSKIVARQFDQDTLKQSKELTNALFQFLLGKREIKSRQLYKEYLQVQANKKAAAAQKAQEQAQDKEQSSNLTPVVQTNSESMGATTTTTTTTQQTDSPSAASTKPTETELETTAAVPHGTDVGAAASSSGGEKAGAEAVPWENEASLAASESLVAAGAKAEAVLKEQQELEVSQKKASRKRKPKTELAAGSATEASKTGADKAEETAQVAPKRGRKKAQQPGEIRLEPSEALLKSEAKANAALQAQQAAEASSKRKRKSSKSKAKEQAQPAEVAEVKAQTEAAAKTPEQAGK